MLAEEVPKAVLNAMASAGWVGNDWGTEVPDMSEGVQSFRYCVEGFVTNGCRRLAYCVRQS